MISFLNFYTISGTVFLIFKMPFVRTTSCFGMMSLTVILLLTKECMACDPGQIESDGFLGISWFSGCDDCSPGTFQSGNECRECGPGEYTDEPKQTKCQLCPRGTFSKLAGSSSCTKCAAGEYSKVAAPYCVRCPAGTYTGSPGTAECGLCPGGTYTNKTGSSDCTACADGMTSPAGSTSSTNCTGSCSAGYIHTTLNNTVQCEECSAGTFSLKGAVNCTECSVGQFSVAGSGSCSLCSPGTFTNTTRSSSCTTCIPGTVAGSEGSSNCTLCPQNTYSNINNTLCLDCHPGSYSNIGSSSCLQCDKGFYHNNTLNQCLKCPPQPSPQSSEACYHLQLADQSSFKATSTPPTPVSQLPQSTTLNERQITALVLACLGFTIILSVTVYVVCWTRCRLRDMYRGTSRSCRGVEVGDSFANPGLQTYSSCSEMKPVVPPQLQQGEENIYDVPVAAKLETPQ